MLNDRNSRVRPARAWRLSNIRRGDISRIISLIAYQLATRALSPRDAPPSVSQRAATPPPCRHSYAFSETGEPRIWGFRRTDGELVIHFVHRASARSMSSATGRPWRTTQGARPVWRLRYHEGEDPCDAVPLDALPSAPRLITYLPRHLLTYLPRLLTYLTQHAASPPPFPRDTPSLAQTRRTAARPSSCSLGRRHEEAGHAEHGQGPHGALAAQPLGAAHGAGGEEEVAGQRQPRGAA